MIIVNDKVELFLDLLGGGLLSVSSLPVAIMKIRDQEEEERKLEGKGLN